MSHRLSIYVLFFYATKHKAPLSTWAVAWGQTLRTLAGWSLKPKWEAMRRHRNAMWRGALDFLRHHWGKMVL